MRLTGIAAHFAAHGRCSASWQVERPPKSAGQVNADSSRSGDQSGAGTSGRCAIVGRQRINEHAAACAIHGDGAARSSLGSTTWRCQPRLVSLVPAGLRSGKICRTIRS